LIKNLNKKMILLFLFVFILSYPSFSQTNQIDGFEIPRLSPKPFSIAGLQKAQISLDGEWNFTTSNSTKQNTIHVPGEWEMQGFTVNEGITVIYIRELNIPADWKGKRIKLRFDGVSSHAVIKVNGIKLGEHEGSFVPFETDITSALNNNKNILEVEVQANTISDKLACTSQYAGHTIGGILCHTNLFALPQKNISNIIVNTAFDKQFKNAALSINTTLANESSSSAPLSLNYILKDEAGKIILQKKVTAKNIDADADNSVDAVLHVKQPQQWNPEHPYLYQLTTELLQNGKPIETIKQKIGFRQVEVKGNILLVNGMPVKLHGVNRHSIYPFTGRSVADSLDVKDAVLFREANCNYIRTSHYPPSEAFLNACDSLGLFVESESSLCWIEHGASPIWKKWNYLDEKFLPYMMQANVEKIIAQRNHASIIIWSLANESRWSPLWAKVNEVVKKLDPSRPTTFHDQCWGGFNNAGSKADIAVYHYPGINGSAACDTMKRPVLFGEYAHISCYSRHEVITDPGVRADYGAPLAQMYDSMYHHIACLGGAIWSGIDDIFHMPDGRIIGYGPWGVIDAWRRAKPEYFGVKKAYSPVVVTQINFPSSTKKILSLFVENRYDFTNFRDVKIEYNIDGVKYTLTNINIRPHGSGIINIPVEANAKEVNVVFIDPCGFAADEEKIVLKKDFLAAAKNVNVSFTENDASVTVQQGNVEYLISKLTGIILSIKKGDKEIVSKGPVFGIVPRNDEDGGKPNVAGNTYQNNIYPIKNYSLYTLFANNLAVQSTNDAVNILMNVLYSDGSTAKQSYYFLKDGTVTAEYEVQYKGDDTLPRQYGMMIQLPKTFDKLTWKRKDDFSEYAANDIGRKEGEAMMNSKHLASVEAWNAPTGDWKDDANDLGSNDFRSTKRYIYNASLTDKNNNGIEIISDGTQSTRSWLQDEKIQLLIADYNNNGSEPFYGSPFTNGRIKIKNKTMKGKVVFRID
jgi:beta-galactosidase